MRKILFFRFSSESMGLPYYYIAESEQAMRAFEKKDQIGGRAKPISEEELLKELGAEVGHEQLARAKKDFELSEQPVVSF